MSYSSDAGLKDALTDWDSVMDGDECVKDTDVLHNGSRSDHEAAQRLARRLYHLEGFRRSDVAKHLGKKWVHHTCRTQQPDETWHQHKASLHQSVDL